MSPGKEMEVNDLYLAQTSSVNYESLCRLNLFARKPVGDQNVVHSEFKENLQRSPEGWFVSIWPWKGNLLHVENKHASLKQLYYRARKSVESP